GRAARHRRRGRGPGGARGAARCAPSRGVARRLRARGRERRCPRPPRRRSRAAGRPRPHRAASGAAGSRGGLSPPGAPRGAGLVSVLAIAAKELALYFTSLVFYALAAVFLARSPYPFFPTPSFSLTSPRTIPTL